MRPCHCGASLRRVQENLDGDKLTYWKCDSCGWNNRREAMRDVRY